MFHYFVSIIFFIISYIDNVNLLDYFKCTKTPTRFSICGLHYQIHCCCCLFLFFLLLNKCENLSQCKKFSSYENGLNGIYFCDVLNNKNTKHHVDTLMQLRPPSNKDTKLVSSKSSENIQKKEDGPDCTISNNKFSSKAYQNEANDYFKYRYEIIHLSFAANRIVMISFIIVLFMCIYSYCKFRKKKSHHPFPFSVSI